MMLSGFFGLIAMETSAGLMALGSVIRTTCWADASLKPKNNTVNRTVSRSFISISLQNDFCKSCNCVDTKKKQTFPSISFGGKLWLKHLNQKLRQIMMRFVVGWNNEAVIRRA